MNKLWNGAEQVVFCQVKLSCSGFCLFDLVMLHAWILLPTVARTINKHKNIKGHEKLPTSEFITETIEKEFLK